MQARITHKANLGHGLETQAKGITEKNVETNKYGKCMEMRDKPLSVNKLPYVCKEVYAVYSNVVACRYDWEGGVADTGDSTSPLPHRLFFHCYFYVGGSLAFPASFC
ncbi:hypothetical protein J6590_081302 [Homalodisca vitripennis]|nr:hypothetical protein J6590_081302 [Homalodisca vitripennis]